MPSPRLQTLLLVGAGPANLHVVTQAQHLGQAGLRVTLVAPEDHWYFPHRATEVLSGTFGLDDFRVDLRALTGRHGARFVQDEVTEVLPKQHRCLTVSGRALEYDLAALAVGVFSAEREGDVPVDGCFPVRPVRNVIEIRNEIETLLELSTPEQPLRLAILGGGPSGVEYALHAAALLEERAPASGFTLTLVEKQPRVLPGFPLRVSEQVERLLRAHEVVLRTACEIQHIQTGRVILERGEQLEFDIAVVALESRVSHWFHQSGLPTDAHGALVVEPTLAVRDFPDLFASGDCARWGTEWRREGRQAMEQGPVLAANLLARLEGRPLKRYRPRDRAQILALGPKLGLWVWHNWSSLGAGWLEHKHRLDAGWLRTLTA